MGLIAIMSWNCKSVNRKETELINFIDKHNIKIVMLSETWLTANKNLYIPNFVCHRVDRFRGGVAILVHCTIPHAVVKAISLDHSEAIVIELENQNAKKIKLASIYCAPSANMQESNEFFDKLTSISGSVIAAGDYNCKHKAWNNSKNCNRGSNLLKMCNQKNFSIHSPDSPTLLPSRGDFSIVDFAISKSFSNISPIEAVNDLSSDHFPIVFDIDFDVPYSKAKTYFNFSKANWKKFREKLNLKSQQINEKFAEISNTNDIDVCISEMSVSIINAANDSIPRKSQFSKRYPFNQIIHNLTQERNRYRKLFTNTRLPLCKSLVSQLTNMIRIHTDNLCEENFRDKIKSLDIKDLSLYQFARNLKRKKSIVPPLKNSQNDLAFTSRQKAELFAESFKNSHQLTLDWPSKHENQVKKSINKIAKDKSEFPESEKFKVEEIVSIIRKLKIRKAPGEDGILNIFIKNLPLSMIKLITNLFNSCVSYFYFPKSWKIASIFPIPKSGKDHALTSGYRPISLLSNLGKLFEKLFLIRMNKFVSEKNIIKNHQFGFREHHSTTQQLVRLSKFASIGFNNNQSTGVVSLDIEKAFDTVWHEGLIHKLSKLSMPTYLIKIIQSYLAGRTAYVNFHDQKSPIFNVLAGVPTGSLLAPTLFICFINDLPTPKDCEIGTYADDTVFFTKTSWKNAKTIKKRLENGFIKISEFYKNWKIKINNEKTESIMLSHSHVMHEKKKNYEIEINNSKIPWKNHICYLGINLDSKLSFKFHIDSALKKANFVISTLFSIFKKDSALSASLKLLIYKIYIRPVFTYAAPLIVNAPKTHLNRLQTMQNKCLRMALNLPRYTWIDELHDLAEIPKINEFLQKLSDAFYVRSVDVANDFVNSLGSYNLPRNFKIKHRLPMKISSSR